LIFAWRPLFRRKPDKECGWGADVNRADGFSREVFDVSRYDWHLQAYRGFKKNKVIGVG
jgi:hypothetical protein